MIRFAYFIILQSLQFFLILPDSPREKRTFVDPAYPSRRIKCNNCALRRYQSDMGVLLRSDLYSANVEHCLSRTDQLASVASVSRLHGQQVAGFTVQVFAVHQAGARHGHHLDLRGDIVRRRHENGRVLVGEVSVVSTRLVGLEQFDIILITRIFWRAPLICHCFEKREWSRRFVTVITSR